MNWKRLVFAFALCVILVLGSTAAAVKSPPAAPATSVLVTGLKELQGSAIGPGGALFVTAPLDGSIWRVDPKTGAYTLFASGLPKRLPGLYYIGSGVVDVAFIDGTAYALVTGVGPDLDGRTISSASTGWTARTALPSSPTSARGPSPIRRRRTSLSPPASSTRSYLTAAGSLSPTATTTGCCGSPSTARSPS